MVARRLIHLLSLLIGSTLLLHLSPTSHAVAQTQDQGWSSWNCQDDLNGGIYVSGYGWEFGQNCQSYSQGVRSPWWLTWGGTYLSYSSASVADGIYGSESCDGYSTFAAHAYPNSQGPLDYTGGGRNAATNYYPPSFQAWQSSCGASSDGPGFPVWDVITSYHTAEEAPQTYQGQLTWWGWYRYSYCCGSF